ncbi:reverse transcriptase domain-containing protein [Williamsia phyllosphaerae]|uniref:Reverse transcriptase domain-containing protein n=1 Tax=Williamsia phyllosphaerae TaxID=885042 RepID=A0ABQ1V344_9NOCA|nr:reverse transcriptase domain-containing protein [Williamsia phyllosphaerae]GGF35349.1 hypothetical protein GCM10007298_33960 [Williamsia phyllosphaerae]
MAEQNNLSLADLVLAYRKSKIDMYYSTNIRRQDIALYEMQIEANLTNLMSHIVDSDVKWFSDVDFLGSYSVVPKSLCFSAPEHEFFYSSGPRSWQAIVSANSPKKPVADFRIMSKCSVDLHVLSTLWMERIGTKYDALLGRSAHGGRLRKRLREDQPDLRLGSFVPYAAGYREWRDSAMSVMQDAVDADQEIIVMTADAKGYYHNLDAGFMLDEKFEDEVGAVQLDTVDYQLHKLFIGALLAWSELVGQQLGVSRAGLPVGLPASAVVANMALLGLDNLARDHLKPMHYGRYIDDIVLIIQASPNIANPSNLRDWIVERSGSNIIVDTENGNSYLRFAPTYLDASKVIFSNTKNRSFHLEGQSAQHLISTIKKTITDRNSEWRSLPEMAPDLKSIGADIASVTATDGNEASTIGDVSGVTAKRAEFAIRLRNFETYARDLNPNEWAEQRGAFFSTVALHIISLPNTFDFFQYVPRLIKLAADCGDISALQLIVESVCESIDRVAQDCEITISGLLESSDQAIAQTSEIKKGFRLASLSGDWFRQFVKDFNENLAAGYDGPIQDEVLQRFQAHMRRNTCALEERVDVFSNEDLLFWHSQFYLRDLAHVPYRYSVLPTEIQPHSRPAAGEVSSKGFIVTLPLYEKHRLGSNLLFANLGGDTIARVSPDLFKTCIIPSRAIGFIFPTRPVNLLETCLIFSQSSESVVGIPSQQAVSKVLASMRGNANHPGFPSIIKQNSGEVTISIPRSGLEKHVKVSVAMVMTTFQDFIRAAHEKPNVSYARYNELTAAMNEAMTPEKRGDYLVMGELSFPSRWFLSFAARLKTVGVDLIAGVEYQTYCKNIKRNQVWAALSVGRTGPHQQQIVYRQDKQTPAMFEERVLREQVGARLEPQFAWTSPPVISHGRFSFAILICSELTNISHRASLRGRVDAVLVPEWNQDLHTFDALVESAANDIHAYVVQVNNLMYGDSRIRVPRKKPYERDVVRLRGGLHNYVVTGQLDQLALRDHQSRHRYQDGDFKPVPDGFVIHESRRFLFGED